MAKWIRMETGRGLDPYYYICEFGDLKLSLNVPYMSDPWSIRLTKRGTTICKNHFRLPGDNMENLEKAQEKAFEIVKRLTGQSINYWQTLMKDVEAMEAQGKEQDVGEEKPAAGQGADPQC